jgi:hypothetical protein
MTVDTRARIFGDPRPTWAIQLFVGIVVFALLLDAPNRIPDRFQAPLHVSRMSSLNPGSSR